MTRTEFEIRIKKLRPRLKNLRLVKNGRPLTDQDIEDAIQTAFMNAWKYLQSYDPSRSFDVWVTKIFVHCCIAKTKEHHPDQLPEGFDLPHTPYEFLPQLPPEVKECFDSLPQHYRAVLCLQFFEELTVEETAKKLNLMVDQVRGYRARAPRAMRKCLISKGYGAEAK